MNLKHLLTVRNEKTVKSNVTHIYMYSIKNMYYLYFLSGKQVLSITLT